MKSAKRHFEQNIIRVKELGNIYKAITSQTANILDLSDILRAEYVMLISALDHFIHEIVRIGMIEIYNNKRKPTKEFKEFILNLDKKILFEKAIMEEKNNEWLDYQIRYKNGFKSFQQADKIEEAILIILEIDFWKELSKELNQNKRDLKYRLNLIVERRNQIAHEADIEPTYQNLREIKLEDIENSIKFIEDLVNATYEIIKT